MTDTSMPQDSFEIKDRLALALEYLGMGFSVIPLRPGAKLPRIPWEEFKTRRATVDEVTRWFKGTDNNIAIVTGAISGVAVVDCDSVASMEYARSKFPSHQRTLTTKGEHLWFKHPGIQVRNSVNLHGIKLDIRGDGGYVVAPGSRHPDGMIYQRGGVWGPTESLPVFPQAILEADGDLDSTIRVYLDGVGPAVQGGGGDMKTFHICCRLLRGFALSEEKALEFLTEWNKTCSPPWSVRGLKEKMQSALKSGSEPFGVYAEQAAQEWRKNLIMDKKGKLLKFRKNLDVIFDNDNRLKGTLRMDSRTRGVYWNESPITDSFPHNITMLFESFWGLGFSKDDIVCAAIACAERNSFNPLVSMILGLPIWDGIPRIERILTEILDAEDTPLHQAMIRCFFIGAIRRALQPGCKLDTALVLVGAQGAGKSTFFRTIGGEFYSDTPIDAEGKDRFLAIHKSWILELAELDGMTSVKTAQMIKGLLSSSVDNFRPPYGRVMMESPRSCIMGGSTNTDSFLMDPTGSRRFWPIRIGEKINTELLTEWRDQILAEAVLLESSGENHWLDDKLDQERATQDVEFTAHDPWEDLTQKAIHRIAEAGTVLLTGITTKQIMDSIDIPIQLRTRGSDMRIGGILKRLGWTAVRRRQGGDLIRYWIPDQGSLPDGIEASTVPY